MNRYKAEFSLMLLSLLMLISGALTHGLAGAIYMFLLVVLFLLYIYFCVDRGVLWFYQAELCDKFTSPNLYGIVEDIARRAELSVPAVYLMKESQPNLFAIGATPKRSALVVTTGLLQLLDREELMGVIAHEMSHIKSRDTLNMMLMTHVAFALAGLHRLGSSLSQNRHGHGQKISRIFSKAFSHTSNILTKILRFFASEMRELEIDRAAADLIRDAEGLASALKKIDQHARSRLFLRAGRMPATAHLFIINPLGESALRQLLNIHPETAKRIESLERLNYN